MARGQIKIFRLCACHEISISGVQHEKLTPNVNYTQSVQKVARIMRLCYISEPLARVMRGSFLRPTRGASGYGKELFA